MTNRSVFISTRNSVNTNLIDDFIYMDSNVLINLYNNENISPTQYLHQFISAVQSNDSILVYSQHSLDEMIIKIHKELQNSFKSANQLTNTKQISKNDAKSLFSTAYNEVVSFESNTLSMFSDKISVNNTKVDRMKYSISVNTGMTLPDSEHIAIAKTNDIHSILTDDQDFIHAEDLNIYGSSSAIHRAYLNDTPSNILRF